MMGRHWFLMAETPAPYATNRYNNTHLRTQFDSWTYGSGHTYIDDIWQYLYVGINRANAVIDNGPNIDDDTEEPAGYNKLERVVGEARFYRALYYFYLVEFFGDVPLRINETTNIDSVALAKTERSIIYEVIIDDLKYAEQKLAEAWEYEDTGKTDYGRPTKGGAKTLLAKVYLQRSQNPEAQGSDVADANTKLDEVIGSGYGLADNYDQLQYFNNGLGAENNNALNYEILFEIQFTASGFGAAGNHAFSPRESDIGKNKWTVFAAEFNYVESFEPGDERYDANFVLEYTKQKDGSLQVYDITDVKNDGYKDDALSFTQRLDPEPANENSEEPNMQIIRFSDVLLLKAEALVYLGQENNAYEYVNRVRRRAYGVDPNTPDPAVDWAIGSKANFKQELYKERLKELPFMTWGTIDLRRMWDVATPLVEASSKRVEMQNGVEITNDGPKWEITDFSDKFKFYPTPAEAMDRNTSLVQHPLWGSN